ncbi:hypothetical protein HDU85_003597 [Gaertneriomyces sp. JEL0708]|nr:hypothetical protein HDU85_003597 [Gaertneriomyces sp. JEL0708]
MSATAEVEGEAAAPDEQLLPPAVEDVPSDSPFDAVPPPDTPDSPNPSLPAVDPFPSPTQFLPSSPTLLPSAHTLSQSLPVIIPISVGVLLFATAVACTFFSRRRLKRNTRLADMRFAGHFNGRELNTWDDAWHDPNYVDTLPRYAENETDGTDRRADVRELFDGCRRVPSYRSMRVPPTLLGDDTRRQHSADEFTVVEVPPIPEVYRMAHGPPLHPTLPGETVIQESESVAPGIASWPPPPPPSYPSHMRSSM